MRFIHEHVLDVEIYLGPTLVTKQARDSGLLDREPKAPLVAKLSHAAPRHGILD
jgi:hypothetical protein